MRLDEISRRGFLKGAGAASLGAAIPKLASAKTKWVPFMKNWDYDDGSIYYYDAGSILRDGNEIKVWIKLDDSGTKISNTQKQLPSNLKEPTLIKLDIGNRTWSRFDKSTNNFGTMTPVSPDSVFVDLIDKLKEAGY